MLGAVEYVVPTTQTDRMNPMANPDQRSISLPAGCKDLMDVLLAQRRQEVAFGPEVLIGGLGQLERHVEKLFTSTAPSRILIIAPLHFHGNGRVILEPSNNGMSIYPETGVAERNNSVKQFFAARNIHPSVDFLFRLAGMRIGALGFLLPSHPSRVSQLTTDLFISVYEADVEAEFEYTFTCCEADTAQQNPLLGS
jgi:hypothetical protein